MSTMQEERRTASRPSGTERRGGDRRSAADPRQAVAVSRNRPPRALPVFRQINKQPTVAARRRANRHARACLNSTSSYRTRVK
jgi:hypothetical protein